MHITEARFTDYLDQAAALILAHQQECEPEMPAPDLDVDVMRAMEDKGLMFSLLVFAGDTLIGYALNAAVPHLHYRGVLFSQSTAIYVAPGARGQGAGQALVKACEAKSAAMGCRYHLWSAKPGSALQHMCEQAGYPAQEVSYAKEHVR